jgi:hypothetical protein
MRRATKKSATRFRRCQLRAAHEGMAVVALLLIFLRCLRLSLFQSIYFPIIPKYGMMKRFLP